MACLPVLVELAKKRVSSLDFETIQDVTIVLRLDASDVRRQLHEALAGNYVDIL